MNKLISYNCKQIVNNSKISCNSAQSMVKYLCTQEKGTKQNNLKGWYKQMWTVWMVVDGEEYKYGTYSDRDRANEIAMQVRRERDIDTYVAEA